jgi:hypothetical protein
VERRVRHPYQSPCQNDPDDSVEPSATAADEPTAGHAAVSQKKAQRYKPEAGGKAKRLTVHYGVAASVEVVSKDQALIMQRKFKSTEDDSTHSNTRENQSLSDRAPSPIPLSTVTEVTKAASTVQSTSELFEAVPDSASSAPYCTVDGGKHVQ